jgi:hypothetical protein
LCFLSLSLSLSFNTKKNKKNNTLTLAEVTLSLARMHERRVYSLLLLKRGLILTNARKKRKGERKKRV